MGKDFYDADAGVRELFEEASDIGGRDWARVLCEGSEDELKKTDVTQMAIVLVGLAASMALNARGITASACAGFSLGEFPALYEAGVLGRSDLLRIVERRGAILEKVSRSKDGPEGPVAMTAVLGLELDEVNQAIKGIDNVYIGLHSNPRQVVLSGTAAGLTAAEAKLNEAEAMKLVRLKVSGPFHSPLLTDARQEFAETLDKANFSAPDIPIFVNTTAGIPKNAEDVKKTCLDQLDHTVRWVDCQKALLATEPERVLEVGPGNVLAGHWKAMKHKPKVQPAGKLAEIQVLL